MISKQNALEIAKDKMQRGELTAAQANVLMVQMEGVRIVTKIPASIRKDLNEAVKRGELGHIKKEGLKPECYHHINARARALDLREKEMQIKLQTLSKVYTN